jgi:hypothetical protein
MRCGSSVQLADTSLTFKYYLVLLPSPPPACVARSLTAALQLRMNDLGVVHSLSLLLPSSLSAASASHTGAGARVAAKLL